MLVPQVENIASPTLAVDLGAATMRGLLYREGTLPPDQCRFLLPSPERVLAEGVRACTRRRRPVHVHGVCMGLTPVEPIREHLKARLGLSMHPETAAAFCRDPGQLEDMGVLITADAPPFSTVLSARECDPSFWNTLCDMTGLPRPERILVAAAEYGRPFNCERPADRPDSMAAAFAAAGPQGPSMDGLMSPRPDPVLLRLSAIQRITGTAATDTAVAFMLGLLAVPDIRERSYRQGVGLLRIGRSFMRAGLVFRNRLCSFLELPLESAFPGATGRGRPDPGPLLQLLEDLRLGWLPRERVAALGGRIWRIPELPAEAEGFAPLYAVGPNAVFLEGRARLAGAHSDIVMGNCWGLLHGYANMSA